MQNPSKVPSTLRAGLLMLMLIGFWSCSFATPAKVPAPNFSPASIGAAPSPAWQPSLPPPRVWKYIVLHHSATPSGSVEAIDAEHRKQTDSQGKPWLGIGYHFVIGNGAGMADGQVEATFRWRDQLHGAHAGDRLHNDHGIGICLIGNFEENPPTQRQIAATRRLVSELAERYHIDPQQILPHSTLVATRCPGKLFPWSDVVPSQTRGLPLP